MPYDDIEAIRGWTSVHHGIISRGEARRLGVTGYQVKRYVANGSLIRVARGVYRLAGSPDTPAANLRAAVLAGGPDAVASHWSAAWLFGIGELPERPWLTLPHSRVRSVDGAVVNRTRIPITPVVRNRIPCTNVIRTIFDCAAVAASPDVIDDLIDRAVARRAVRIQELTAALQRADLRKHPARAALTERLARRGVVGSVAPSVLESRMARLFLDYGLPAPKAEVRWGPQQRYRLDFAYPEIRLAVEVDGWSAHFTPEQQRWDRRRGNTLATAGWTVLHYDWWEVTYEPDRVAHEIEQTYRLLAA
jgi:predicted transcriptional regulator of viral defense system